MHAQIRPAGHHHSIVNLSTSGPQNPKSCPYTHMFVYASVCMFACLPAHLEHNKSCWHAGGVPILCTSTSIRWVMTCHALSWSLVKAGPSAHLVYGGCGCRQVCMECVSEHTCMDCFHCMHVWRQCVLLHICNEHSARSFDIPPYRAGL